MRPFAPRQPELEEAASSHPPYSAIRHSNEPGHPLLSLQRKIGNQAMLRLLQTDRDFVIQGRITPPAMRFMGHYWINIAVIPAFPVIR